MEAYKNDRLVTLQQDRNSHDRYDHVAVATMLYLFEHGRDLPSRFKKQVQHVVKEEYEKRLKDQNK